MGLSTLLRVLGDKPDNVRGLASSSTNLRLFLSQLVRCIVNRTTEVATRNPSPVIFEVRLRAMAMLPTKLRSAGWRWRSQPTKTRMGSDGAVSLPEAC